MSNYLTAEQVIDTIKDLAQTQGCYSRLYSTVQWMEAEKPELYEQFKKGLEIHKFKDPVDVAMFFEA